MFGGEEAEELFEEKLCNDDERGEKKKQAYRTKSVSA